MFGLRRVDLPRRHTVKTATPEGLDLRSAPRPGSRALVRRVPAWLPALLIALVALLPRVADLNDFYTTDEAYFWQGRVARFTAALSMGDWAATNQTGHPGVTTMWLGSLGRQLAGAGVEPAPAPAPGGGAAYLAAMRLPLAVTNALAAAAGYLLLRRLLRPCTALLAGLFWATSPFLIAHGRLLHLDALLASFVSLSLLALLVATRPGERPRLAALAFAGAGAGAGLALLTKAPALILLPVSAAILLAAELRAAWAGRRGPGAAIGRAALRFAAWLAVAALVVFALWPAMWVGPAAALGAVAEEIVGNGAQPHSTGNFFMGQPVADPGWGFYISVMAWRGEVPVLLGLTALLALAAYGLARARRAPATAAALIGSDADEARVAIALGGFVLLFTLALSLLAKKFDRYLLPIWPSLAILGAIGLMAALDRLRAASGQLTRPGRAGIAATAAAALAAFLLLPLQIYRPYYLAYYNPLLGGGTTAQAVLLTGWGEGMEQAGAWLSARPDLRRGPVLSWLPVTLAPFLPADVAVLDLDLDTMVEPASYAVIYSSVAERDTRAVAEAYALQTPPLYRLRVHGITYVTIHQLPRPFDRHVGALFGGVHLRGYSRELRGSTLTVTPSWDIQVDRAGGVFSFIHVVDEEGRRVAQIDAQLDDGMFAAWQAGQQFGTPLPITLPADLPAGTYTVVLGLYTQPDGAREPLTYAPDGPAPERLAGPNVVRLFSFEAGEGSVAGIAE